MLTLHLEAATIDELRVAAIEALDLRLLTKTQVEEKVGNLLAEPVKGTVEEKNTATVPTVEAKPAEEQAKTEPKKRGRKPKDPALSTIAESIETPKQLDLESVRAAFDQYVQKFGVQAAQIDGPVMLSRIFGNGIQRIKDVPEDDQGKLGRIIAAVEGAILTNEFQRPTVQ